MASSCFLFLGCGVDWLFLGRFSCGRCLPSLLDCLASSASSLGSSCDAGGSPLALAPSLGSDQGTSSCLRPDLDNILVFLVPAMVFRKLTSFQVRLKVKYIV